MSLKTVFDQHPHLAGCRIPEIDGCPTPTIPEQVLYDGLRDRPLVYVAGYFSANPMHGTANAVNAFDRLVSLGWLPLVPHASIIVDMLSPHTSEFWYELDLGLLKRCDAMFVCDDPLTAESSGVAREIRFAKQHGIPVFTELSIPDEVLGS